MSGYEVPSWSGKPPTGLHLDVMKESKLIQKLMVDDKKCYLFGRNSQLNDFCIDHNSCSRVHAALVYHKHLQRTFLVDLGSTHGTFIGRIRLEANKPTQLPIDSSFHFGASTRFYILRERPQAGPRPIMEELERAASSEADGGLLGLPESETELDNLTEFNTAHNRRITMMGIADEVPKRPRKIRITFSEEEMVINPEDVDPSVGKFRNMIETTVIPKKRARNDLGLVNTTESHGSKRSSLHHTPTKSGGLYDGLDQGSSGLFSSSLSAKMAFMLPNPAPDVEMAPSSLLASSIQSFEAQFEDPDEPKKRKKYAKEAWPGKKNAGSLLV